MIKADRLARRFLPVLLIGAMLVPALPTEVAEASSSVATLQRELKEKGFYRGAITGTYNSATRHAIMGFRKEIGASRSYTWSNSHWDELRRYKAPYTRYDEPDRVEINLTRQVAHLFIGGVLKGTFPVASGNGEIFNNKQGRPIRAVTPTGNFKITRRKYGWYTSYLGSLYNPWFFNGGIALHGSNSVPAYPASHGCVRLTIWDSNYVNNFLYIGMPVHVWNQPAGTGPVWEWDTVATGDFDGNGRDDIVVAGSNDGKMDVFQSNGSSFSESTWADYVTGTGWGAHLSGDFSGDGKDDFASFHPSNGTWWVGKSTGTAFSPGKWADYSTARGWNPQLVGDFIESLTAATARFQNESVIAKASLHPLRAPPHHSTGLRVRATRRKRIQRGLLHLVELLQIFLGCLVRCHGSSPSSKCLHPLRRWAPPEDRIEFSRHCRVNRSGEREQSARSRRVTSGRSPALQTASSTSG